ncbi:membrane protein [Streptococcus suis]|nr:membrane protein [Streptococcus suis]
MNKTVKNGVKVVLLFFVLFLINILVFKVLSLLGFEMSLTERSYLFPPLLATLGTALLFYKMKSKEKRNGS